MKRVTSVYFTFDECSTLGKTSPITFYAAVQSQLPHRPTATTTERNHSKRA